MLVPLKRGALPGFPMDDSSKDPLSALLACHQRIRHFVDLANKLALHTAVVSGNTSGTAADLTQVAEAAFATHRYFTVALPLHVQDEDQTLTRYLSAMERQAIAQMNHEHGPIEAACAQGAPFFAALAKDPALSMQTDPSGFAQNLQGITTTLAGLILPHLQQEEVEVFPLLRLLSPAQQAEILGEFRDRRAP